MLYTVRTTKTVDKALDSLPRDAQRRIVHAVQALAEDPRPRGCKKLEGSDAYRIRVGEFRVVYSIVDRELLILVLRIANRREVYR